MFKCLQGLDECIIRMLREEIFASRMLLAKGKNDLSQIDMDDIVKQIKEDNILQEKLVKVLNEKSLRKSRIHGLNGKNFTI